MSEGKKILFVASVYTHFKAFHLPFIKALKNCGYDVYAAASMDGEETYVEKAGAKCYNVPFSRSPFSIKNYIAYMKLNTILENTHFDLIHVHTPVASFIGRYAARKNNQGKVLYTAHGFHFYKGAPLINWLLYYPLEVLAARWTDGIISINQEDFMLAQKKLTFSGTQIHYVPGVGIELQQYNKDNVMERIQTRSQLGLSEEDIILLTVAEINKNKNQAQVIEALIPVIAKIPHVRWLVVGEGPLKETLKKEVDCKKLGAHINFLGYRTDIAELINASDIFILTSKREGLPRCIMEAMAAGKPILGTQIRGIIDLVVDGYNGSLFTVGDVEKTSLSIERLTVDQELRKSMGEKSRQMIRQFDLENVLRIMSSIYERYLWDN